MILKMNIKITQMIINQIDFLVKENFEVTKGVNQKS